MEIYRILLSFKVASPNNDDSDIAASGGARPQAKLASCLCEIVSVDEAYLELPPGSNALHAAESLRASIFNTTGCKASVGIGDSKLTARLATRQAKPPNRTGIHEFAHTPVHLPDSSLIAQRTASDSEDDDLPSAPASHKDTTYDADTASIVGVMARLPLQDLPGVGPRTAESLARCGYATCGDITCRSLADLLQRTSAVQHHDAGQRSNSGSSSSISELTPQFLSKIYEFCSGVDTRVLSPPTPQQSLGIDVTWGIRFATLAKVHQFLSCLVHELDMRATKARISSAKCITIKLMQRHPDASVVTSKHLGHGKCVTYSRCLTLKTPAVLPFASSMYPLVLELFAELTVSKSIAVADLRGLGIQCSLLMHAQQRSLLLAHRLQLAQESNPLLPALVAAQSATSTFDSNTIAAMGSNAAILQPGSLPASGGHIGMYLQRQLQLAASSHAHGDHAPEASLVMATDDDHAENHAVSSEKKDSVQARKRKAEPSQTAAERVRGPHHAPIVAMKTIPTERHGVTVQSDLDDINQVSGLTKITSKELYSSSNIATGITHTANISCAQITPALTTRGVAQAGRRSLRQSQR